MLLSALTALVLVVLIKRQPVLKTCVSQKNTIQIPKRTIAAIPQVGPDDVFLREAEDSQSASSHRGVYDDTGVCHHLRTLVETNSEGEQRARSDRGRYIEYIWI